MFEQILNESNEYLRRYKNVKTRNESQDKGINDLKSELQRQVEEIESMKTSAP